MVPSGSRGLMSFQSTLPVGGTNRLGLRFCVAPINFNPRSPWGERPEIKIRLDPSRKFQSTLPVGGATPTSAEVRAAGMNFNPRSPWGERHT